jgi:hypothetical protein
MNVRLTIATGCEGSWDGNRRSQRGNVVAQQFPLLAVQVVPLVRNKGSGETRVNRAHSFGMRVEQALQQERITTEKIAVFAPMENANVRITVTVKPGLRRNCRAANASFCPSRAIADHPRETRICVETPTGVRPGAGVLHLFASMLPKSSAG